MIIYFTIIDCNVTAAQGLHRLVAGRGEIYDREPSVGQCHALLIINPYRAVIRAAMVDLRCHIT